MTSKSKIIKAIQNFSNVCKEILRIEERIKNAVKNADSSDALLNVLKTKVNTYEQKLENSFSNLDVNDNEEKLEKYLEFQDVLFECAVLLENTKPKNKTESQAVNSNAKIQASKKLPKLELPHFYGDMENWISFKELFQATVINNSELSKIDKLQYLFASTKGNAAKLIRGFAIREENLKNCWELLCERFENKSQLANCQINKLFNLKIQNANSSKLLFEILDNCNECIRNLSVLGLEVNELTELIIINHCVSKLDDEIIHRWDLTLNLDAFPTLNSFKAFIEREARSLDSRSSAKNKQMRGNLTPEKKFFPDGRKCSQTERGNWFSRRVADRTRKVIVHNVTEGKSDFFSCFLCQGNSNHPLYKCPVFNRMKIEERLKAIEGICCRNCLRKNHKTDNCKINIGCKVCKNRHHTLLHNYKVNLPTETDVVAVSNGVSNSSVLLSTAVIKVKDHSGKFVNCRALIDNASQLSLISKKLAHQLNLPLKNTNHKLTGINGINAETSLHSCQVEFTPHFSSKTFNLNALVVNKVTSPLPNFDIQIQHWPHLDNLILADPNFYISQQIDILLGADIYALLLDGLPIFGPSGTPAAISTKLGYILTGKIYTSQMPDSIVHSTLCDQLNKFWSVEKFPPNVPVEKIYDPCEEFYQQSVCRNDEGRFIVSLPFKEDKTLGESKEKAIHLFFTLENKLNRNPPLKERFNKFMKEYLSLGHMKAISIDREKESPNCYIPYHMIQNDNSSTTKCRVVFNASAKTSNGKSLNNILLIGPKLQTDIFSHLVKFRSYRVAFSADIEKMYRQF
ncbi:hypothetical protein HNY73_011379 [Argiope bruennichi]|uniref:Peptidase aspartic putative domain-containing protein n=1 Tax=Argiope bruennichi TaxID=94029 RepID=A0A8T0F651_ARGBR|nr:hypothetical protein HNY73_011379 [Argiope bruennichi]